MLNIFFYVDSYIDVLCAKPNPLGKIVSIEKYRGTYIHALILCEVTVIANLSKDEENQLPGLVDWLIYKIYKIYKIMKIF